MLRKWWGLAKSVSDAPAVVDVSLCRYRQSQRGTWQLRASESMARIFVTGGAGFIGSALARCIIGQTPHEALVFDKLTYAGNLSSLAPVAGRPALSVLRADICDPSAVRKAA